MQASRLKYIFVGIIMVLCALCYYTLLRAKSDWLLEQVVYKNNHLLKNESSPMAYQKIMMMLNTSKQLTPNNPQIYLLSGNIQLQQVHNAPGKTTQLLERTFQVAEQDYAAGVRYEPNNPFLWGNLAIITQKQPHKIKLFKQAINQARYYGASQPSVMKTLKTLSN